MKKFDKLYRQLTVLAEEVTTAEQKFKAKNLKETLLGVIQERKSAIDKEINSTFDVG
jgi:hypothetical protein